MDIRIGWIAVCAMLCVVRKLEVQRRRASRRKSPTSAAKQSYGGGEAEEELLRQDIHFSM